jgi:hypothetical protein
MRLTAVLYTPLEDKAFTQPRTQGFLLVLTILVPEPFLRAFDPVSSIYIWSRNLIAQSEASFVLTAHTKTIERDWN